MYRIWDVALVTLLLSLPMPAAAATTAEQDSTPSTFADASEPTTMPTPTAIVIATLRSNPSTGPQPPAIKYHAFPAMSGETLRLYVDGKDAGRLAGVQGTHVLKDLAPGDHRVTIKVIDADHAPTGVEASVSLTMK